MNEWALLSVSDKSGIVCFAKGLVSLGYDILSTGGTAEVLQKNKVPVTLVSDYTGCSEILDGQVKTLHPKIYAGILAKENTQHKSCLEKWGYEKIKIVAVNLYPFKDTIARSGVTYGEALEQIDIGGVTLLRAAAKNHERVLGICCHEDYHRVLHDLMFNGGVPYKFKRYLAYTIFEHMSMYDREVAKYLLNNLSELESLAGF
jgi:phosphoribosylaminoimidazolecarboxamide formyltransferase/IMP cyclohydrolase